MCILFIFAVIPNLQCKAELFRLGEPHRVDRVHNGIASSY